MKNCENCRHYESCIQDGTPCKDYLEKNFSDNLDDDEEIDLMDYTGDEDFDDWVDHEDFEFE